MGDNTKKTGLAFGIFSSAFILLFFLSPWLAFIGHAVLGRVISNFLFFWPQMALLPLGIMNNQVGASQSHLADGRSVALAIIFWVLAGIAYAWFVRRLRFRTQALLAFPVIVIVTILMNVTMSLAGYSPYLDGP